MVKANNTISISDVKHVVKLANLPAPDWKISVFHQQLEPILEYVKLVQSAPTQNVEETTQTTGLTNVLREDVVDSSRTFTQDQALLNAPDKYKGYFKVPAIFEDTQ